MTKNQLSTSSNTEVLNLKRGHHILVMLVMNVFLALRFVLPLLYKFLLLCYICRMRIPMYLSVWQICCGLIQSHAHATRLKHLMAPFFNFYGYFDQKIYLLFLWLLKLKNLPVIAYRLHSLTGQMKISIRLSYFLLWVLDHIIYNNFHFTSPTNVGCHNTLMTRILKHHKIM